MMYVLSLSTPLLATHVSGLIDEGQYVDLIVPHCPLNKEALELSKKADVHAPFNELESREAYNLLQRVQAVWNKNNITNYLFFSKVSPGVPIAISAVPYETGGFFPQLLVLANMTFGPSCINREDLKKRKDAFEKEYVEVDTNHRGSSDQIGTDPFCNSAQVEKQLVIDGTLARVLYNIAPLPLNPEKLHFLIVPKAHRERFSDLTEDEYVEIKALEKDLIARYAKKGFDVVYIFNKNGKGAGQTVPHFHEHVIFAHDEGEAFFGKLLVFKNMLWPPSKLSEDEFNKRLESIRQSE